MVRAGCTAKKCDRSVTSEGVEDSQLGYHPFSRAVGIGGTPSDLLTRTFMPPSLQDLTTPRIPGFVVTGSAYGGYGSVQYCA
jgi:hypothetical protein